MFDIMVALIDLYRAPVVSFGITPSSNNSVSSFIFDIAFIRLGVRLDNWLPLLHDICLCSGSNRRLAGKYFAH